MKTRRDILKMFSLAPVAGYLGFKTVTTTSVPVRTPRYDSNGNRIDPTTTTSASTSTRPFDEQHQFVFPFDKEKARFQKIEKAHYPFGSQGSDYIGKTNSDWFMGAAPYTLVVEQASWVPCFNDPEKWLITHRIAKRTDDLNYAKAHYAIPFYEADFGDRLKTMAERKIANNGGCSWWWNPKKQQWVMPV